MDGPRRREASTGRPRVNVTEMSTQADFDDEEKKRKQMEEENQQRLDFTEKFLFSDAVIKCERKELHCHRAILSLYSPVFKAMFEGNFKETKENTVDLPDKYEDVVEVLKHMYTPGGRDMDTATAKRLLPLVHKYQIGHLIETAEKTISFSMTDSSAPETLVMADTFGLNNLRKAAIESCAKLEQSRLTSVFAELSMNTDLKSEILNRRVLILEKCITDIQRSFTHSCMRMESKLEKVPANHCHEHVRPLQQVQYQLPNNAVGEPNTNRNNNNNNNPNAAAGDLNRTRPVRTEGQDQYNVSAGIRPSAGLIGTIMEQEVDPRIREARVTVANLLNQSGNNNNPVAAAGNATTGNTADANDNNNNASTTTGTALQTPILLPPATCERCVENLKGHIGDLCKRAMHKIPIVLYKQQG